MLYLIQEKLYDTNKPLFPRTTLKHDENNAFVAGGLVHEHWTTTTPIRQIFKEAFQAVGLPYYNSAFLSKHSGRIRTKDLHKPRTVQSLEPELRS